MKPWVTVLVCAAILGAAALATLLIFGTEPEASRVGATKETAMLVEVTDVQRGTYRPRIEAMGTVRPARSVVLSPRVEGEVVERSSAFTPGGFVREDELLVRIDPADYENELAERQSELDRARAELQLEMGRQQVARQDFELLRDELSEENASLVLREPQLATAKAAVAAAEAAVEQAELMLARTTIAAPFDAHVLTREVDVGSQVSPGEPLGHLVGLETYWVVTTVPLSKLRWISVPDAPGEEGSPAEVRNPAAWGPDLHRDGRVERLIGSLDEKTRLARLLVTVADPLGRLAGGEVPALTIGAFVEVEILGEELEGVVRLNRDLVRQGDTVWLMEEGGLSIRPVEVLFRDAAYAYVSQGLEPGERVITTNLATVVEGAPLRLHGEEAAGAAALPADPEASTGRDASGQERSAMAGVHAGPAPPSGEVVE